MYKYLAKSYDKLYGKEQIDKIALILKYIEGNVLDVGCGTGLLSLFIKNYVGIDNCKEMLEFAKKRSKNLVLGDAEKLPFKSKSFDTVVSLTVLQNIKNKQKAIKEMIRVAKRKVIISMLNRNVKFDEFRMLFSKFKFKKVFFENEKDYFAVLFIS